MPLRLHEKDAQHFLVVGLRVPGVVNVLLETHDLVYKALVAAANDR